MTLAHNPAGPTTPLPRGERFRLGPVRSPLLRPSRLISLPLGTEMFQFPGFALVRKRVTGFDSCRVAPFGHLGINACVPLPRAYRSLPRPSSPPCAQASPTCLHSLDYINCDQAERLRSYVQQNSRSCANRTRSSSDNLIPNEIKSLSIRILNPRSTKYFHCQTASTHTVPQDTASKQQEIELGNWMWKRATYESFQMKGLRDQRLTEAT